MLITQSISNSLNFPEVSRKIHIAGINMNSDSASFDIYYRLSYHKNGLDITHLFNAQNPDWHIDNSRRMRCRDANFVPIPNPSFLAQVDDKGIVTNEIERFVTMPAFDYIKMLMLDMNVPLQTLIQAYIAEEDADGRFNF